MSSLSSRSRLLLAALFLASLPAFARAGGEPSPLTATAVSVGIVGTSTLHGWKATAESVTLTAALAAPAADLAQAVRGGGLKSLDLAVSVASLKSSETAGMDRNMHRDLGGDKLPEIRFHMTGYRVSGETVTARGSLEIHGVARAVKLTAHLAASSGGLVVKGSYPLRMSDYGIKPPVMMFGTIKVADPVTVVYSFRLEP